MSGRPLWDKMEVSETYVSTSRYKRLILGKCMHKALTHFVDLADENQHNRRTYWYISSNIGKYETEFFQCLQMNFDNSQGTHCQRKLIRHLRDTNCLLQSKALKIILHIWFKEKTTQICISIWFYFKRLIFQIWKYCLFPFDAVSFVWVLFRLYIWKLNIINYHKSQWKNYKL